MLHLLQPADEESVAIEEIKALGEVVQEVELSVQRANNDASSA